MNQDGTGAARSLKAKHSAAVMFDYLGDLKDDFLLHSKQKNTFHVDSNSHNTAFKTKQPQNPIDCTHDGNPSKLEAACWHFSQEKKKKVHTDLLYFSQDQRTSGVYPLSQRPAQAGHCSARTPLHEEFASLDDYAHTMRSASSMDVSNL